MAILGENIKTVFLKGIEALGKGASTLAEGAQQKINEINLESRRREVLSEIPKCVRELYKQGIELPEELTNLLNELSELDEKLSALRPQPQPPVQEETASAEEETCACEENCECEETAQEMPAAEEEPSENA